MSLQAPPEQIARVEFEELRDALGKLPDDQREALVLVGASGFSYEEAAEDLRLRRRHDQEPGQPCPDATGQADVADRRGPSPAAGGHAEKEADAPAEGGTTDNRKR